METDLEQIKKPLPEIIKAQIDTPKGETEMFFDEIHLSPLKVNLSLDIFSTFSFVFPTDSCQLFNAW